VEGGGGATQAGAFARDSVYSGVLQREKKKARERGGGGKRVGVLPLSVYRRERGKKETREKEKGAQD